MSGYPRPRAATRAHRLKIPPILVICTLLLLSLALTSAPVQAAPPIANDDRYTVDEDSLDNRLDVLANDRDPDGDTLKVITVTQGLYGNVLIIDGGDRVSYTPKPEFYGDDFFTYRVDDGHGGSDTARVDVTVRGINDPPIAQDDQAVTKEDNDVTVDVLVNDSDSDGALDPSTVTRISGPSHGSATVLGSTGVISYTPSLDWYGDDTFTYEVCDDGTPLPPRCDTATVSVTVIEENDPPVANAGPDQSAKTNANVTLDGSGSYDPEGDLPLQYSWTPPNGLSDPHVATPTFTTPDNPCVQCFELRVIDSRGKADLSPDSVCITVTNRAPVAYAGVDQDVLTGGLVQLDGTGSYDPDNDYRLKYLWIQTSGPNVSLSSNSVVTPTFTAPGAPSTLTFALYVVDALDEPDLSPDVVQITVHKRPTIYLPMLSKPIPGPDLVVQSIRATRNNVQLVIRNQGNVPIQNGFFVDVYINPSSAPTRVNQTWLDLADQGMVWGVKGSALQALVPGASITLEYRDKYYLGEYSTFYGSLSPGTAIYAQVDSFNDPNTGYGTVLESHEKFGGEYNNILGPVGPTAAIANHSSMVHPTDPGWLVDPSVHPPQDALDTLPARP